MKFGIISTANIGRKAVVPAIQASEHEVLAVASRDGARARAFAADLGIPRAYGSYEALLADADLDAVYNPLPNALHAEWTRRAADAGLHVLCEKPLAADAPEARALGDYCAERGVTLMEAFMYRFHPRTERVVEVVATELADVRSVAASFHFSLGERPDDVRLNPDLAGGSVMDVGCYAVNVVRLLLGEPDRVYAHTADTRDCGVDTEMTGVLEYDDGVTARVSSSFETAETQFYRVEASNGWLQVDGAFNADPPATLEYTVDGRRVVETFDPVDQYRLQVEGFVDAVREGRRPRVSVEETVHNMRVLDALRESGATGAPVTLE